MQASLQLMTAGHRQRELGAGKRAWTTPGQWDISTVSMGTDAEWQRLMPAQSSGRLDGAGMKTQKHVCWHQRMEQSKALNTDGSEWAQDSADQNNLSQPGWSAALIEQNKVISDSPGRQTQAPIHS